MCKNTNKKMIQFSDTEIEIETVSHDRECFDCGGLATLRQALSFKTISIAKTVVLMSMENKRC